MTIFYRCDDPEEFRNSSHYRRTIEDDRRDAAEARTQLWHYTNLEVLFKIAANKTIRFSRIDRVNDLLEKKLLMVENMYLGTYIACFNHDVKESIPLWSMYTSKGRGVRIGFEFDDDNVQNSFIGIDSKCVSSDNPIQLSEYRPYIHDIEYSDEMTVLPITQVDGDVLVSPRDIAFEKTTIWEYEKETRIMMFNPNRRDDNSPDYIDFLLDFRKLKALVITFDPWMTDEIKQSIRLTVQYYLKEYVDILDFQNSELEGKIR